MQVYFNCQINIAFLICEKDVKLHCRQIRKKLMSHYILTVLTISYILVDGIYHQLYIKDFDTINLIIKAQESFNLEKINCKKISKSVTKSRS